MFLYFSGVCCKRVRSDTVNGIMGRTFGSKITSVEKIENLGFTYCQKGMDFKTMGNQLFVSKTCKARFMVCFLKNVKPSTQAATTLKMTTEAPTTTEAHITATFAHTTEAPSTEAITTISSTEATEFTETTDAPTTEAPTTEATTKKSKPKGK